MLGALDLAKTTEAERLCRDALALHARLFRLWYRCRGDPAARGVQRKCFALGERHLDSRYNDVRNVATALFAHHETFFVFVHRDGVEPTDNRAERASRGAVFGDRSETGECAVARLLTVTRTCQTQQLNALADLTAAIRAHRRHQAVASLLPKPS